MSTKKSISVREGLFKISTSLDNQPQLIGGKCRSCNEIIFPKPLICPNCQELDVEEIMLSRKGKIFSNTVIMQQPRPYYKGPVPYGIGFVELPDGVRVQSLFTGADPELLKIGDEVELVIEKLYDDDEGNELITYKFRAVDGSEKQG